MEKADAVIQEEIMVMRHFFGDAIFEIMIMVATLNRHQSCRGVVFSDEEMEETKVALQHTFNLAFGREECEEGPALPLPSLTFISINDPGQKILETIKSIQVRNPQGVKLVFQKGTCVRCAIRVSSIQGRKVCFVDDNSPLLHMKKLNATHLLFPSTPS